MNSDFSDLLRSFNSEGVEYLIVGGYAVMRYAEPRFTKDLDLWVRAEPANAHRVYRALAAFGAPLQDVTVDDFARPGYAFQIGVAPVRVDVLMSVSGLSFEEAWPNRNLTDFGGVEGWVISRTDLVRNKRASARPQDLIDADNLEQAARLDSTNFT